MMTDNQNDQAIVRQFGEFSAGAWLVAGSEASAEDVFLSLSTKKEAEELKTQQQDSNTPLTSVPANADPQQGAAQEPLRDEKQFFDSEPAKTEQVEEPSSRKSTGPRTSQGKQRSKFNALKHGFFSKAVLLEGESATEFKSFLDELRQDRQPKGELETVLVEYLAVLLWRRRRYLEAERGGISKSDFIGEDFFLTNQAQALDYVQLGEVSKGELGGNNNLRVIRGAISILDQVRIGFEAYRLNKEEGSKVFSLLFPQDQDATAHDRMVRVFHAVSKLTAKFKKEKGITEDSDSLNEIICQSIQAEIERLSKLFNFAMSIEDQKTIFDFSAARIPSQEALDRFLRIDAHTSREIDRTMQQLERLQRMRRGQPLPPQLDVKIS